MTLVVLSPAIAYGVALLLFAIWRRRCRECHRRGVKAVGGYLWDGKRGGGAVTFYLCEKCGAHFKQSAGDWSVPLSEEWDRHVRVTQKPNQPPEPTR